MIYEESRKWCDDCIYSVDCQCNSCIYGCMHINCECTICIESDASHLQNQRRELCYPKNRVETFLKLRSKSHGGSISAEEITITEPNKIGEISSKMNKSMMLERRIKGLVAQNRATLQKVRLYFSPSFAFSKNSSNLPETTILIEDEKPDESVVEFDYVIPDLMEEFELTVVNCNLFLNMPLRVVFHLLDQMLDNKGESTKCMISENTISQGILFQFPFILVRMCLLSPIVIS
ncbi:hypothetical protein K7X08_003642 [Anisodus acutangulus]|uniref:Uncharacterized protein n=1 Tax=Anisodus acutangulus TaxID=402998 RepID=A0A9Q1MJL7_9SOLA|nr:hypothetical protein K7X08_003642 [Anisodus acutangulus]